MRIRIYRGWQRRDMRGFDEEKVMGMREDLVAAKALIDTPEKWGKGSYQPSAGCYCVLGAGREVVGETDGGFDFKEALKEAVPPSFGTAERKRRGGDTGDWWVVFSYNDDPATTHADVMALFDRAIEAAS